MKQKFQEFITGKKKNLIKIPSKREKKRKKKKTSPYPHTDFQKINS